MLLQRHLHQPHLHVIMPWIITSDSEDQPSSSSKKLFGRQMALHSLFGGGKVADMVLWRNKHVSAAILAVATVIWFLFEVVEYNFLTLLCHISIIAMLAIFIWCNGAALLDRTPPKIPDIILSESQFREVALAFHAKLSVFLSVLFDIAIGKDLKLFLLAIGFLWMFSVVGSYCSSLSLLYFGFLCIQILPALYERYEEQVDSMAVQGSRDLKKLYRRFDSNVLNKIPRGPVKEKKLK